MGNKKRSLFEDASLGLSWSLVGLKLIPAFEPVSQVKGIFWAQTSKCDSHCSANHYRLTVYVPDQGFVLLQGAGRMGNGDTG